MLAMALIVVMPAISRVMPMAGAMPDMDAACTQHMAGAKHPGAPDSPADPTAKCGYCVLLHHLPVLPTGAQSHLPPAPPGQAAPALPPVDDAYVSPILSARPRGPPRIA
nr:DUF2946 domain-containing protein [Dyella caseinilytica]